jgi:4-amino-4-deoxy-L-arabinose transferase-like glycosyltransferase
LTTKATKIRAQTQKRSWLSSDEGILTLVTLAVSLLSFLYFFKRGEILLYGDAVAHINIARRVVDSLTPGLLQLGTVWLPLPHLITIPFVLSGWAWMTGVAGSIGSMAAYVLGAVGIFRLVLRIASKPAAWLAAAVYVLNPNLIYMQATAMTESIYLASVIWAVVFFIEFVQEFGEKRVENARRALVKCALTLMAAMLTRYDGWVLAACVGIAVLFVWVRSESTLRRAMLAPIAWFLLLIALPPLFWFGYNWRVYKNPLEFANGPYSARAIAEQSTKRGESPHPGYHSPLTAWIYFIKTTKLNVGDDKWQNVLLHIAVLATLLGALRKQFHPALLLWIALPFYIFSIAYGGVPIFIPVWTPYSYYNVRYGLQLLPAIAVFVALGLELVRRVNYSQRFNQVVTALFFVVVALSYVSVLHATPITLREARVNAATRVAFETALAKQLVKAPPNSTFMMYTGNYVGALQQAGIHLSRVVTENNYDHWRAGLKSPASAADYIVAIEGDPVGAAVKEHPDHLQPVVIVHSLGKPPAEIFRSEVRR